MIKSLTKEIRDELHRAGGGVNPSIARALEHLDKIDAALTPTGDDSFERISQEMTEAAQDWQVDSDKIDGWADRIAVLAAMQADPEPESLLSHAAFLRDVHSLIRPLAPSVMPVYELHMGRDFYLRYLAALSAAIGCLKKRAHDERCNVEDVERRNAEDAERWRALIGSARVRVLGSAGLRSEFDPNGREFNGYAHIGLELWTKHNAGNEPSDAVEWVTKYADIARRAQP